MKLKKTNFKVLILIFFVAVITVLFVDYSNIMYPVSKNLNYDFLNIFINSSIVIFVFLLTYYMIEKQTSDREKIVEYNKKNALRILLTQVKKECTDVLEILENQYFLEHFIISKIDFDSHSNLIEENLKNNPFKNEQYIINLFEAGIANFQELDNYINLKQKFQKYISLKIALFDLDEQKEKISREKYEMAKKELQKLHDEFYLILNNKLNL